MAFRNPKNFACGGPKIFSEKYLGNLFLGPARTRVVQNTFLNICGLIRTVPLSALGLKESRVSLISLLFCFICLPKIVLGRGRFNSRDR